MAGRTYGQTKLERRFGVYNRPAELMLLAALGILLAHWAMVIWFVVSRFDSLGFLRLHYTVALGVDWIDVWWKIFVFPAVGLATLLLNSLLAGELGRTHRLLGQLTLSLTIFLQLIFAAGGAMALLLNG